MDISVSYDKITAIYTFHTHVVIDGLNIHKELQMTEEMVEEGDKILEYLLHGMLMDSMKLASEAVMPKAMLKTKGAISQAKAGPDGKAKPFTLSVKYGNTVTDMWKPEQLTPNPFAGNAMLIELGQYVDLNQQVSLPDKVMEEFPNEDLEKRCSIADAIIALNDVAEWSYDQIADWLEAQDVDIAICLEGGE